MHCGDSSRRHLPAETLSTGKRCSPRLARGFRETIGSLLKFTAAEWSIRTSRSWSPPCWAIRITPSGKALRRYSMRPGCDGLQTGSSDDQFSNMVLTVTVTRFSGYVKAQSLKPGRRSSISASEARERSDGSDFPWAWFGSGRLYWAVRSGAPSARETSLADIPRM